MPAERRRLRRRQRLDYDPQFEGVFLGWAINFIKRHLWKFSGLDFEDLLQEAWIAFEDCKVRYEVEGDAHLMALYKKCLLSQVFTMARKEQRRRETEMLVGDFFELDSEMIPLIGEM